MVLSEKDRTGSDQENESSFMKICMIVPDAMVKGGIASVVNGYRSYDFGKEYEIIYVESYCDGSKWKKLFKALKGYLEFAKVLKKEKPDLVHVHSSFGPSFYRKMPFIYMAYRKKLPIVNHIHGAEFDTFYLNATDKKKSLIRKVYQHCDRLIALSEEWKERLKMIVPEEKITVLTNYCTIPADLPEKRKNQMLFLGEIGQRKGGFDIPSILAESHLQENSIRFIFAGDGQTEDIARIKKEIEEKGLGEWVKFPGWVRGKEKEQLLRESKIFLFPSYNEGMPMAVLEAMAYGLAIVTTEVGGIPKLITDGEDGYLCRPGDTESMGRCIRILFADEKLTESMSAKARQKAVSGYSRESHIRKLLQIYRDVLEKRGCDQSDR